MMDLRTKRTRKLIIESFNDLIRTTDFQQITVKLITETAQINRATFYAHFVDKFELLDVVLRELIQEQLQRQITATVVNAQLIGEMFSAVAAVHDEMQTGCRRGYDMFTSMIEDIAKEEMKNWLISMAPHLQTLQLQMVSWAIYGAFIQWQQQRDEQIAIIAQQTANYLNQMLVANI